MDLKDLERTGSTDGSRGELERALRQIEVIGDVEQLRARHVGAFAGWSEWVSQAEESAPLVEALATLQRTDDVEGLRARHVQAMDGWIPWGVGDGQGA